ncbi:MAG: cation:proton antiporter [Candidatus Thermoplasmatota archaeon]|jgi:Kef-type K+ transport system membrane component KefB|nr:cation:proton antiporter [Candidatus Thermoplasmatota archaeon]
MFEGLPTTIEFQLSLLLFVALAGYLIASKINQSAIVWEILVGIAIGPSLLGLITYTDCVETFAHLGAVVLLFVVGLEFNIKDVFNVKYGIIALIGVIVPWLGGYFLAEFFGYDFISSVFVGTAMTATSIAITANVLREMGKLQTEAAKAIIGAAVIDDVLGLLVLSFSMQVTHDTISIVPIVLVIIEAVIFMVIGAYVGHVYLSRLIEKLDATKLAGRFPETIFLFAMVIAFFYAMIAELIGLSAIVGAFLAGVALTSCTIKHGKNFKEGAEYLMIIFASIFFVSLGILADFHTLTLQILWFLITLTIVAFLTKIIGCYVGARIGRMSHKNSLIVGMGMAPRGEVAMIVALIGLNLGVIQQDIYVSIILMSLLTTIFVPIVLRHFMKD